ncbi:DUF5677 domain-containing protein [Streptomyces sp. B21-083]|uniref:DUF5677 domain-containing protein n=1 Tax=Streptomyces sp. B21-083 TaxID=3039410 RepID=UPI002FF17B07
MKIWAMDPEDSEQLQELVTRLAADAIRRAPRTLGRISRRRHGFQSRLRRHWGRSLDLYELTLHRARELGAELSRTADPAECDALTYVLTSIHARACRVADEVHCLLTVGHGQGALKSARVLYELAVVSMALSEYGRQPGHEDLVDRYLAHADVIQFKAMKVYQEHAPDLGQEPFSPEEVEAAEHASETAKAQYGKVIGQQFGWAANLPGAPGKTTEGLAAVVGIAHLHPYFDWASAESHGGAHGVSLNTVDTRRGAMLMAGPSVDGLVTPASLSLICLHHCTLSLVVHGQAEPDLAALVMLQVVDKLRARTDAALKAAHEKGPQLPLVGSRV